MFRAKNRPGVKPALTEEPSLGSHTQYVLGPSSSLCDVIIFVLSRLVKVCAVPPSDGGSKQRAKHSTFLGTNGFDVSFCTRNEGPKNSEEPTRFIFCEKSHLKKTAVIAGMKCWCRNCILIMQMRHQHICKLQLEILE